MPRVTLIHWKPEQSRAGAAAIRKAGYTVGVVTPNGMAFLKTMSENPPAAVVIDLDRLPSHGRDIGVAIRNREGTRRIPLVFAGGEKEKIERVRETLPDAVYTPWAGIAAALRGAIAHAPPNPVAPKSNLAGYSGTPLAKKLGIKPNTHVALLDAPDGFIGTLGELPAGVEFHDRLEPSHALAIWFVRRLAELEYRTDAIAAQLGDARVWIVWPKRASGLAVDVSERDVRNAGLAAGLVDYKIAAIDATWSGLLFVRRRAKPPA